MQIVEAVLQVVNLGQISVFFARIDLLNKFDGLFGILCQLLLHLHECLVSQINLFLHGQI